MKNSNDNPNSKDNNNSNTSNNKKRKNDTNNSQFSKKVVTRNTSKYNPEKDKNTCNEKPKQIIKPPPNREFSRILLPHDMFDHHPQTRGDPYFSKGENEYLNTLPEPEREKLMSEIKQSSNKHGIPLRFRVLQSKLPNRDEILQRLKSSCDSHKFETWVESALSLPIKTLAPAPITDMMNVSQFLKETREKMDNFVFGQNEAKDEITRLLCQWSSSGFLKSFAIALEGPPGIGKTTFAKNVIANVMNRPFNFIGLGGASDASCLIGHSYTYEGAIPGRIVESLKSSKVMNPVFYFDEMDKISKTTKGDEITNVLIHLTDREQNMQFHDRYFNGIDLDISNSLFVFSYNEARDVNPVLLDRLNVIKLKTPTVDEKIEIAKRHLIPRAMNAAGIKSNDLKLEKKEIEYIINKYTNEFGVRNLEKALCKLISTVCVILYAPDALSCVNIVEEDRVKPFHCKETVIDEIIGNQHRNNQPVHYSMYA